MIFGTALAYCLTQNGKSPFSLTGLLHDVASVNGTYNFEFLGQVKAGLPDIKPPPFSTVVGNRTLGYGEILSHLGTGIISIPMVSFEFYFARRMYDDIFN